MSVILYVWTKGLYCNYFKLLLSVAMVTASASASAKNIKGEVTKKKEDVGHATRKYRVSYLKPNHVFGDLCKNPQKKQDHE